MKTTKFFALLMLLLQSFLLEAVDGSFVEIAGSPFAAGANPANSAYTPIVSGNIFAGVPNFSDQTVSVYLVNQSTGAFTPVAGSPFATGSNPAWLAFSPLVSGNLFAAIVNQNDNTVSVYEVNQTTGAFSPVAGSPFATGLSPFTVGYSPVVSGNLFAAVANSDGVNVTVYQVNQTTGAFTEIAGSPFAAGVGPYTVVYTPVISGNLFAAVTNFIDNTVTVYEVNQTTGAFTEIAGSPFATGSGPYGLAFSPILSGNLFASVVNLNDNTVSVYQVNSSTGAFTPIAGSPFAAGGTGSNEVAYSPVVYGDLFAAVVNFASNNVSVYLVNQTTGAFTAVAGSPFATGGAPDGIAFTPLLTGGLFACTANYNDNNASVFQVTLPPAAPLPPSNFVGVIVKNEFINKSNCVLEATWDPSPSAGVVAYKIYKDGVLVTEIPATSPYFFVTCLHKCSAKGYTITAVNSANEESTPVKLKTTNK